MVLSRASSLWVALAVASCGGDALNLGSTDGGRESDGPTGPAWKGTFDGVQLQDGSNRLTLRLSSTDGGPTTGTLLLGDGALLPSATDPDIGYPPGASFSMDGPLGFFEGFPYPLQDASFTGSTLTFRIAEYDLWSRWCAIQTKTYAYHYGSADGGTQTDYGCVPGNVMCNWQPVCDTSKSTSTCVPGPMGCTCIILYTTPPAPDPTDCGKYQLCSAFGPCQCSAKGCAEAMTTDQLYLDFTLVLSGSSADGTISGIYGDHPVHFLLTQ